MKSYGQYCPIARAAEVFAERWTPIIVRNIALGCHTFTEILEGAPGLSRSLLVDRLRTLERSGIVVAEPNARGRGSVYAFTEAGEELAEVCRTLGAWGERWMSLEREHLDPVTVLWAKTRTWDVAKLPQPRVVIRFDLEDYRQRLWILVQPGGAELCAQPPGFEEDLVVETDCEALAHWHLGRLSYAAALRSGRVRVRGPRALVRSLPGWLPLSPFAA